MLSSKGIMKNCMRTVIQNCGKVCQYQIIVPLIPELTQKHVAQALQIIASRPLWMRGNSISRQSTPAVS